jgi:hypothetical protein
MQQVPQELVDVLALERGGRDPVQRLECPVAGVRVSVYRGRHGLIERLVEYQDACGHGRAGLRREPSEDALAKDGVLEDDLDQIDALVEALERVELRRRHRKLRRASSLDVPSALGDVREQGRHVVQQRRTLEPLDLRSDADLPFFDDFAPLLAEERREIIGGFDGRAKRARHGSALRRPALPVRRAGVSSMLGAQRDSRSRTTATPMPPTKASRRVCERRENEGPTASSCRARAGRLATARSVCGDRQRPGARADAAVSACARGARERAETEAIPEECIA